MLHRNRAFPRLTLLAAVATLAACQSTAPTPPLAAVGAEVRAYPAGVISGIHAQVPLDDDEVIIARLAYNRTDRDDYGEMDHEDGGGMGGGFGYRRYFGPEHDCWFLGGNLDVWDLEIDWREDNPPARGETDVIVIQPTIEGGYGFVLSDRWRLDLSVAFGFEINVDEDGEDVGDGAILLVGVNLLQVF